MENKIPPTNTNYGDRLDQTLNIDWPLPQQPVGEITYKITNEERKGRDIISSLPYSMTYPSIPPSFKVNNNM